MGEAVPMIVVNGVRYRREDAERLGLVESVSVKTPKARSAANKARTADTAANKEA